MVAASGVPTRPQEMFPLRLCDSAVVVSKSSRPWLLPRWAWTGRQRRYDQSSWTVDPSGVFELFELRQGVVNLSLELFDFVRIVELCLHAGELLSQFTQPLVEDVDLFLFPFVHNCLTYA